MRFLNICIKRCSVINSTLLQTLKETNRKSFNVAILISRNLSTPSTSKPNINIGTIGHIDHGKTTLTAAITKIQAEKGLARYVPYDRIDSAPEEKKRGITINLMHIGFSTDTRNYAHIDCPGHADFIKNMITGTSQMDAAILVVAASEGIMPQTREHISLAKQIGVKHVVVYANKADLADKEMCELVELEIRELLESHGYASNTPIIFGSALAALEGKDEKNLGKESIIKLLNAIDTFIPLPERDYKSPFYMPIEKIISVQGRGQVIIGTVVRGVLKKGETFEIVGFDQSFKTSANELHIFKTSVNECKAGENVGILSRGLKNDFGQRGMVAAAVNSVKQTDFFEASVYMPTKDEGGKSKPIVNHYTEPLFTSTITISAQLQLPNDKPMLMPGDHATVQYLTQKPVVVLPGDRFTVREQFSKTTLTGVITKALPKSDIKIVGFNTTKMRTGKK